MKFKYRIMTALVVISFMFGGITARAQGIFSPNGGDNSSNNSADEIAADSKSSRSGGLFRLGEGSGETGQGGDGSQPGKEPLNNPIGEGILILSLLSGGYALVKRKSRKEA